MAGDQCLAKFGVSKPTCPILRVTRHKLGRGGPLPTVE